MVIYTVFYYFKTKFVSKFIIIFESKSVQFFFEIISKPKW